MLVREILTEIKRLTKSDYEGGKGSLDTFFPGVKKLKPLPGGSGMHYRLFEDGYTMNISIWDLSDMNKTVPKKAFEFRSKYSWEKQAIYDSSKRYAYNKWTELSKEQKGEPIPVGRLNLDKESNPVLKNVWRVNSITTNEDYRGGGYALALYGLALTIKKVTLMAGESQTPGGRKMWMKLASISGVEVKGITEIDDYMEDYELDAIMKMGGDHLGYSKKHYAHYFAFDVTGGRGELTPAVKTSLNKIYKDNYRKDVELIAQWKG